MSITDVSYLQIEPTTRCNFTCKFCCGRKMSQEEMPIETFHKIISGITNLKHIQLQGEGEPLLHPYFFELLDIINKYHPNAKISTTTNGSMLTNQVIDRILNSNIYSMLVSIESPNKDKFMEIRGGNLENIINNMQKFMHKKKELGRKYPILGFAVTVLNKTIGEFKDIIGLYHRLELDGEFTVQFLQNMDIYTSVYDEEMKKQIPASDMILEFQRQLKEDKEINEFLMHLKSSEGFFDDLYSASNCERTCIWLNNALYFTVQGAATGCSYIKDPNEGFGNIHNSTISEILLRRNNTAKQLLDLMIPKHCSKCPDISI